MRVALMLIAFAAPLSACGGVSLNAVAKAADKASKTGSEHVTMSATVTGAGQNVEMHGNGDFRVNPSLGRMTVAVKQGSKSYRMQEVLSGTTIYMQSPLFATVLHGKHWVSLDLQKAGKTLGINFNQLASQSPSDTLVALERVGSVKQIGNEVVDGVDTTHYQATIDISKNKALKKLEEYVSYHYKPVDVWIGKSDGLPVRTSMTYIVENAGNTIQTAMTMDFSAYGEQVNVHVPKAGDTADMTSLGG